LFYGIGLKIINKIIYQYDDKGNNIEIAKSNANGDLIAKGTFKYDDKGT